MSDTNNNFGDLKRLLKLKQHEVPPPGYFNHFSGDVISRIRAGETSGAQGFLAQFEGNSFMMSLLQLFQVKPGVIGGFATSLCLLLLIGVVMAERPDGTSAATDITSLPSVPTDSPLSQGLALAPADSSSGITISSNSMVSLQPTVATFAPQQNPLFQTVGFTTGQ
jgi:hypothetical protein